jgi:hypothetical protein
MIYTSLCIMFLMRADTLCGQVEGGWALEREFILALGNGIEPIGECHLGPKKQDYSKPYELLQTAFS